MPLSQFITKMGFERAERRDQDARGGLLADPPAGPALSEGPFLERALPADDMPQARPRWRGNPPDRADRPPHRNARRLDPQSRRVVAAPRWLVAEAQPRNVERAEWIELRQRKAPAEILAGLPHPGGDRPATLHERQRIDCPMRPCRPPVRIGNDHRHQFDRPMLQPLKTDHILHDVARSRLSPLHSLSP